MIPPLRAALLCVVPIAAAHAAEPPMAAATRLPDPPPAIRYVAVPEPLPLPGQLKPLPTSSDLADPRVRIAAANAAARVQPTRSGYINAVQVYPWSDGALYQLYAAPGQVTDIALEPGEALVGAGPVAAGDTVRWIIGDAESGAGVTKRVHILVKPIRPDLQTNLVINTDRRTYHIEMRATERTYMASLSWSYPAYALTAVHGRVDPSAVAAPVASGLDVAALRFRYRIEGDRPAWRPVTAFDDGTHTYIQMPPDLATSEAPPLFVLGADRKAELVNYRVRGTTYVVDRLFAAAELRLGGKRQQVVRIVRTDAGRRG